MTRSIPKAALLLILGCGLITIVGCGDEDEGKEISVYTPKGQVVMRYVDLVEGTGPAVKKFDTIEVHYTGTLANGKKFDSSRDSGKPFRVPIGMGKVIQGWDEGIPGMKVGGKRKLIIPSALGYGDQGTPDGAIPPRAKLIFEVEVLKIL